MEEENKITGKDTKYADEAKIHTLQAIIDVLKENFPYGAGEILKNIVKIDI